MRIAGAARYGSYPFQDEKGVPNTNIVVRSRNAAKLAEVRAAVEAMLAKVKARMAANAR